ncbi:MAG TPA: glycoside hydrolase family 27 protein, partial [Candidatus Acidoferrum sp.]
MCIRMLASFFVLCLFAACSSPAQTALAPTPPMGWNSWNHFACKVTAADVRGAANAISSNGMKEAGYLYVNVDDCWQ